MVGVGFGIVENMMEKGSGTVGGNVKLSSSRKDVLCPKQLERGGATVVLCKAELQR